MEKQIQNIQDVFLNNVRKDKVLTTIHLMTGATLTGKIKSFDKYSVILESNNQDQLIFKHAISTISLSRRSTGELRHSAPAPDTPSDQPTEPPAV